MARTTRTTSPAKKTPAKKTAKKTTPRARKQTPPRLSLVKPTPTPPKLPARPRDFMTDTQGYATLAARIAGITTPHIRDWHDHGDGTTTRPLTDGSHLHYTLATRTLRWQATCPMGAIHEYILTTPSTATAARVHADRCQQEHTDLTQIPALTPDELAALGIHTGPTWARPDAIGDAPTQSIPVPLPSQPRVLGDQLTRTHADTADTQPLPQAEIAAGLTARADTEAPKEHPQP
ncbi:hypothetical protein ACIRNU_34900 [Streptomyces rochei]|uniref:hypothetical protein n=1 Tax=Streptomyces rochei TaxID=1928 RepID=UPI0037F22923